MTNNQLTDPQAPVTDEELDQMIWKLERDGMTPKMLSLMRELREVRRAKPVTLSVWYGAMPESNGRENWTAMLHRKGAHPWEGIMIDRSEYHGRTLYEADRMRFLIGEIDAEPDILAYGSETHSGYAEKLNQPVSETERTYPNSFTDAELEMMAHGDNPQANAYRELLAFRRNPPVIQDCWCRTCRPVMVTDMCFVVCPECGNKRCPHANDHRNSCAGINES